jgi:hypothetical protein
MKTNFASNYIIIALVLLAYFTCSNQYVCGQPLYQKVKTDSNRYELLRQTAFSISAEQLELSEDFEYVYKIIMEWNLGSTTMTVVGFITGDASLYISTGQLFIGGFAQKSINEAAINFTDIGAKYLTLATEVSEITEPNEHCAYFYIFIKDKIYRIKQYIGDFETDKSDPSELFVATNKIITEFRILFEENK